MDRESRLSQVAADHREEGCRRNGCESGRGARRAASGLAVAGIFAALLLLGGCAAFLRPEQGMNSTGESRIALAETKGRAVWETSEVRVQYSLQLRDGLCTLDGELRLADHIVNSFQVVDRLFFYATFVDDQGRVLETVDIGPVVPAYGSTPESLPLKMARRPPSAAKAFVFHYFGTFRTNPLDEGGSWDIGHFPFAR